MAGQQPGSGTERPAGLPGDPVRELMDRHRALCEQAVDALDIAAGLEDSGLGPAEAARYRHVDVFALAEELYARVPRRPPDPQPPARGTHWQRRTGRALRSSALHALPCAVLLGSRALPPPVALALLAVCGAWLARVAAGRRERPRPDRRSGSGYGAGVGSGLGAGLGYGLGVALLLAVPLRAREPEAAFGLAAALGVGSVEWSAGWLRQAARDHLGSARTLAEFRARMRPALPVAVLLHLAVLAVLCFAALSVLTVLAPRPGPGGLLHQAALRASGAQWAGAAALGLLLVSAAVLRYSGRSAPAAAGLVGAGAGSALLTALRYDPGTAQLLCCGAAAALLLPYAWAVLGRVPGYLGPTAVP
ncbi:hypothetical protein GCM10009760_05190 [Kitasatospora kazusensis]|uniref:Integral membrane protein n=1 Tax=Kitasatospora kazusensis TaxID=407974 RepID=A0ABN2YRN8_9ACTN